MSLGRDRAGTAYPPQRESIQILDKLQYYLALGCLSG